MSPLMKTVPEVVVPSPQSMLADRPDVGVAVVGNGSLKFANTLSPFRS